LRGEARKSSGEMVGLWAVHGSSCLVWSCGFQPLYRLFPRLWGRAGCGALLGFRIVPVAGACSGLGLGVVRAGERKGSAFSVRFSPGAPEKARRARSGFFCGLLGRAACRTGIFWTLFYWVRHSKTASKLIFVSDEAPSLTKMLVSCFSLRALR